MDLREQGRQGRTTEGHHTNMLAPQRVPSPAPLQLVLAAGVVCHNQCTIQICSPSQVILVCKLLQLLQLLQEGST